MGTIERINGNIRKKQIIRLSALYCVMNSDFQEELQKTYGKRLKFSFLSPRDKDHHVFNVLKKRFMFLAEEKPKFSRKLHKLQIPRESGTSGMKSGNSTELVFGKVFYNPISRTGEPTFTISKIHAAEGFCLFCGMKFEDLESHIDYEIGKLNAIKSHIEVRIEAFEKFAVEAQTIQIDIVPSTVRDFKGIIFEKFGIPVSRQHVVCGEKILKNTENLECKSLKVIEKKK